MADYTHTIDRWDEATGENLIERIAGVSDYLVALEDLPGGGEPLARGQDHAAQPGAGDRAELGGLGRCSFHFRACQTRTTSMPRIAPTPRPIRCSCFIMA